MKQSNNNKRYSSLKILTFNITIMTLVVLTNVYIRSLTKVHVEVVEGIKQVKVVKAYYEYFQYLTMISVAIIFICWIASVYLLIYQRKQVETRLHALTEQFNEIGISRISLDNPIFTEDEKLIINTWNTNIDIIEKQINDRERYLNSMVHDFKIPIQILKSNVQIYNLKYGENKYVSAIEEELHDLERDVLNYLVVEKINYFENVNIQEYDTASVFDQVVKRYGGLDFEAQFNDNTTKVNFDTDLAMFMKIIDNIIENAMKHGTSEWIKIDVYDDKIQFTNTASDAPSDDIFSKSERHLSVNGNGLGVEIIKTYSQMLGYTVESKFEDNLFIVSLDISRNTRHLV